MAVSEISYNNIVQILAAAVSQQQAAASVQVAALEQAIETQEEITAQLLETMGIGQNIDIYT